MSEPKIQLCYSDDSGRTWSNWRELGLGEVGEYQKRLRARRLGATRNRVWRIRTSAPVTVNVLGAVGYAEPADA
jgi:hypothetical protein